MRVYLDVCCYNRPFDTMDILRNRLEAEAVLEVIRLAQAGTLTLVGSDVVSAELSLIPSAARKAGVSLLVGACREIIRAGDAEFQRAAEIHRLGVHAVDAAHLACAESGHCDAFLTTDDRVIRNANKPGARIMVRVSNPLNWIAEVSLQ